MELFADVAFPALRAHPGPDANLATALKQIGAEIDNQSLRSSALGGVCI